MSQFKNCMCSLKCIFCCQ